VAATSAWVRRQVSTNREKQHEGDTRRVVRACRPDRPLNVEGELLAQERVLGGELGAGAEGQSQQVEQV